MTDPYSAPIVRSIIARPGPPGESADTTRMAAIEADLAAIMARAVRPVVPDLWYGPLTTLDGWEGGLTTLSLVKGKVYGSPFACPKDAPFDGFGIDVTTAVASSTIRMGVYEAGSDGYPAALVQDMGTVDSSATGFRSFSPIDLDLTAGAYWIGGACSHNGVSVSVISSLANPTMTAYMGIFNPSDPLPVISLVSDATLADGFTALPAPFGAADISVYCPAFMLQAA